MDTSELRDWLREMRRINGEPALLEVKSGAGGYPKSVVDSIVSFANTDGGTIIIGVDEPAGFTVVGVDEPGAYREAAFNQARDGVEPSVGIAVDIVELDGKQLVVIDVPEADPTQKPLHLKSKGPTTGALVRTGDGDRRMTHTEIGLLYAGRTQPTFDRDPVLDASTADFDRPLLLRSLERIRSTAPSLRDADEETVLRRIGAVADSDGTLRPTLGGLLAFGAYPQQYHPQLFVSFVSVPREGSGSSERFLDNISVRGGIPAMVADTVAAVRRNLATRATVTGDGRAERLDLSLEAVREAIVNALVHRDYSGLTLGAQVQVELHADRLVVRSPGGLYGPIAVEDLGEPGVSSSRNSTLVALLSDTFVPGSERLVVENRASGVPIMLRESRVLGQPRPEFESRIGSFTVTLSSSSLLSPDVLAWIEGLGVGPRSREKDIALAMLHHGPVTNEMLREWGMDRIQAGAVLRELVTAGVATRLGGRRYASYVLVDGALSSTEARGDDSLPRSTSNMTSKDSVYEALRAGATTTREVAERTGLHPLTVRSVLNAGIAAGEVVPHGAPRSPKRAYSVTDAA